MNSTPELFTLEISFNHIQPVETSVSLLATSEDEAKEILTKLFEKRQDLVIASCFKSPDTEENAEIKNNLEKSNDDVETKSYKVN